MKYLALTDKGTIHNIGDCGDWEAADEIAVDSGLEYFYMTSLNNWLGIAEAINKEK